MNGQGTAAVCLPSSAIFAVVEEALRQMGFEIAVLQLAGECCGRPEGDFAAPYRMVLVDHANARALRTCLMESAARSRRTLPPIVVVQGGDESASTGKFPEFDGTLLLPLARDEIVEKLDGILQVQQRARSMRLLPPVSELSIIWKAVHSVANGICVTDAQLPDMPIIYVNPAFERMTGYTLDEIQGKNCRFLNQGVTDQPGLTVVRSALRAKRDTVSVLKNFRKDGTPFWNELHLSPLRNERGIVTHFVGVQNDITKRVEAEQRLAFLAHYDALTDLANRALLFDRLRQAAARSVRYGTRTAVLYFDLNRFKHVNDTYGHDAGDLLLRTVAGRLMKGVRDCDTVARLGGDEFVVLLPDMNNDSSDEEQVPLLIERLQRQLGEPLEICGHIIRPSASVGWSLCPRDGRDAEELLKAADAAMYTAKHASRKEQGSRETVYSPEAVPASS